MLVGGRRQCMMSGELPLEGEHRRGHNLGRIDNDDKVRLRGWTIEKVICRGEIVPGMDDCMISLSEEMNHSLGFILNEETIFPNNLDHPSLNHSPSFQSLVQTTKYLPRNRSPHLNPCPPSTQSMSPPCLHFLPQVLKMILCAGHRSNDLSEKKTSRKKKCNLRKCRWTIMPGCTYWNSGNVPRNPRQGVMILFHRHILSKVIHLFKFCDTTKSLFQNPEKSYPRNTPHHCQHSNPPPKIPLSVARNGTKSLPTFTPPAFISIQTRPSRNQPLHPGIWKIRIALIKIRRKNKER